MLPDRLMRGVRAWWGRVTGRALVLDLMARIESLEERLAISEGERKQQAGTIAHLNCKMADGEID